MFATKRCAWSPITAACCMCTSGDQHPWPVTSRRVGGGGAASGYSAAAPERVCHVTAVQCRWRRRRAVHAPAYAVDSPRPAVRGEDVRGEEERSPETQEEARLIAPRCER
jgi:hypothetical protein